MKFRLAGETGTQNHEGLAGLVATIDYLAELGRRISPSVESRRGAILAAMEATQQYESTLCKELIAGLFADIWVNFLWHYRSNSLYVADTNRWSATGWKNSSHSGEGVGRIAAFLPGTAISMPWG